jgi:hypothetical protein
MRSCPRLAGELFKAPAPTTSRCKRGICARTISVAKKQRRLRKQRRLCSRLQFISNPPRHISTDDIGMIMSENSKVKRTVGGVLRQSNIRIGILAFILLLLGIIIGKDAFEGHTSDAVQEIVTKSISVLQNNGAVQTNEKTMKEVFLASQISEIFEKKLNEKHGKAVVYELLIHTTMALIVALVVINAFERQMREENQNEFEELRKKITENVWKAVCKRLVPEEATEQIETLLKEDFVKKRRPLHNYIR